jgi:polysaccharide export outer membrane protein
LGVGNIQAAGRTLNNVRNEVRNVLIRNGLTPNFQLDITDYKSKKAFVTHNISGNKIIPITNVPMNLKEASILSGLTSNDFKINSQSLILRRDKKEYKFNAKQLFDLNAPDIFITNNDQISINVINNKSEEIYATVGSNGNILLPGVGILNAENKTLNELRSKISDIYINKGRVPSFQIELKGFNSKKAYLNRKNVGTRAIPITNSRVNLKQILFSSNANDILSAKDKLSVITLKRKNKLYRITLDKILDPETPDIWIQNGDHIEVEDLSYKLGQVFALSGTRNASIVPIDPSKRESLANILFQKNGPLENLSAKRSEIYLLRGSKPAVAYHLDAQNVSRILVAAKTQLRPNDIIYVADRPIISFARVLSEITPLRILLRDIQDNNIP